MEMKKYPAPGNLDFVPVPGGPADLVFGVVRRQIGDGPVHTVPQTVLKRLCPGGRANVAAPWVPTAYRWDVLLPPQASDEFRDPKRLCEKYEEGDFGSVKDLVVMMTLRFRDADRLHRTWEDVRAFAREHLCDKRHLAVIAAMHLPAQVGSTNPPHIHLMALARDLRCYGFGGFIRPFASDQGKAIFAREWAAWQEKA